jgi:hypothetical protein
MALASVNLPKDDSGNVINRAMGTPVVEYQKYLSSATKFADIFDLTSTALANRVFCGIAIRNPSATVSILIAIGDNDASSACIVVPPSTFIAFDNQSFGNIFDEVDAAKSIAKKVRARLDTLTGTLASGTIIYAGQPTNGQYLEVNGTEYEFTSDASAETGRVAVTIGASADLTYTALVTAINNNDFNVTASINTGTDTVTITANIGGTTGNAITIADGDTGATFSGATLASGAGGVLPQIHIW